MKYSVITISRQYGSGGREIGTQLAQRLGIPFYDKALCAEAARRSGFDESFLEQAERQEGRKFSYLFQSNSYSFCRSLGDQTFLALATTIWDLAEQGPAFWWDGAQIGSCQTEPMRFMFISTLTGRHA